jgi:Uncharacterised nucleotidyltransferase
VQWSTVNVADDASVGEVLLAVAAYGLAGTTRTLPAKPLPDEAWELFFHTALSERLIGLLAAAVEGEAMPVTGGQRDAVEDAHVQAMARTLVLERVMLDTVEILRVERIDVRLLKGSAFAHLDYPDPALRPCGDVDLLVRGGQFDVAVRRLEAAGLHRVQVEPRRGFASRFGKGVTLRSADGIEIDLHRTLAHGSYGFTVPLDEMWRSPSVLRLAATDVAVLSAEDRLLHAAYHLLLGAPPIRLLHLRDVAEMALYGGLDASAVRRRAALWRAEAVLSLALRETWSQLEIADVTALSRWAELYRPSESEKRQLAAYGRPGNPYSVQALKALSYVPGVGGKIAFAGSLVLPQREFLEARGLDRRRWIVHGMRATKRQLRGRR